MKETKRARSESWWSVCHNRWSR